LLLFAICWASVQAARCSLTDKPAPKSAGQGYVLWLTVVPLFLSATATFLSLWLGPVGHSGWHAWYWPVIGSAAYGLVHIAGVACRIATIHRVNQKGVKFSATQAVLIPVFAFVSGAIGGTLLIPLNEIVTVWRSWGHGFAHGLTWGPALFVAAVFLTRTVHIGFMKLFLQPEKQEGWSPACGAL